jgi:hypothetical protein
MIGQASVGRNFARNSLGPHFVAASRKESYHAVDSLSLSAGKLGVNPNHWQQPAAVLSHGII